MSLGILNQWIAWQSKSGKFVFFCKSTKYTEIKRYCLVLGGRHDLGQPGPEGHALLRCCHFKLCAPDVLFVTFIFFCKITLITLNSADLIGLLWELHVFVQMWMKFYLACKMLRKCKKADFLVCFSELAFVVVQLLNHFQLFATPWIAAQQASLPSTIFWNLLRFFNCSQISLKKFKEKV